jgi:hypothetical protein
MDDAGTCERWGRSSRIEKNPFRQEKSARTIRHVLEQLSAKRSVRKAGDEFVCRSRDGRSQRKRVEPHVATRLSAADTSRQSFAENNTGLSLRRLTSSRNLKAASPPNHSSFTQNDGYITYLFLVHKSIVPRVAVQNYAPCEFSKQRPSG